MQIFLHLLDILFVEAFGHSFKGFDKESMSDLKTFLEKNGDDLIKWLIDNGAIEEIKSEKKSGPDLNDYIKYIADTENPVKTLVNMLK